MASIKGFIAAGDFTISTIDSKSRIAPVTQNGKPVLICLSATPELQTPFSPGPSDDGGERTSLDLICTPELERLAEHLQCYSSCPLGAIFSHVTSGATARRQHPRL